MAAVSAPHEGDILVREDARHGRRVFILSIAPTADQFFFYQRDAALIRAVTFAKAHGLAVWFANAHAEFDLVQNFRS